MDLYQVNGTMMPDIMWPTEPLTTIPPYPIRVSSVMFLFVFAALIISGNILVLLVYTFTSTLNIPVSIHMKSLACADLWVGVNCAMNIALTFNNGVWPFGLPLCKLTIYLLVVTVGVSVSSLTVISADRYIAICHPMSYRNLVTRKRTRIAVMLVWVFNCLLYLPSNFDWFRGDPMTQATDCRTHYQFNINFSFFIIAITIIPNFVVSFVSYVLIVKSLRSRHRWMRASTEHDQDTQSDSVRARRREQDKLMAKIGMAIISAFYVTWLPYLVIGTMRQLKVGSTSQMAYNLALYLGISNSFLNCFIYSIANKAFRMGVCMLLKRVCCGWRKKVSLGGSAATTRVGRVTNSSEENNEGGNNVRVSKGL